MKRKYLLAFAAVLAVTALTGCQKQSKNSYDKYVTLGDYTGMTIDRIVTTVTDDDVQEEIQNELYADADFKDVTDRGAKEGDTVNIDYTGTIDGKEFDGGSDTGMDLELGSGTFLAEFEDGIIGMKTGETKDITITFPDDYDGTVDGQTAVFSVTVNSITEAILPEYNDDYVKENYDFDTTTEYEASLKADLQQQYDDDATFTACSDALTEAVGNATFDGYPEDMYDSAKTQLESENQEFADQLGIDWTDLVGEDYDIEEDVIASIHEKLVVYAIAEKENLSVTDEDIDAYAEENWEFYDYDTKEDFIKDFGEDEIRYNLLYDKVLNFLGENNTFHDIDEDEYYSDEDFTDDEISDEDLLDEESTDAEEDTTDSQTVSETDAVETESDTNA